MRPVILADTGPIVAFLHERDAHHEWAVAQFASLPLPFLTCEAVLTEAAYLLHRHGFNPGNMLDLVREGGLQVVFNMEQHAEILQRLLFQYADLPMDLADACLVRMAEQHPNSQVLTLDSDFHVYRKHRREPIPVLMPT